MTNAMPTPPPRRTLARRGAAMVEFAIVAFALYLILAAMLTFGRAIFSAQVLQQTADVFARELSRTPLPPTETLQTLFRPPSSGQPLSPAEQSVRDTLFDEQFLDIDIAEWQANDGGLTLMQYLENTRRVPLVNRLLVPLMIVDQGRLTYPGATRKDDGHYYVYTLHGSGVREFPVVDWVPGDADQSDGAADPFALSLDTTVTPARTAGGLSQIRLNYPFQSASLSSFSYSSGGTAGTGIPVGQPGVTRTYDAVNETPDTSPTRGGLYGGDHHLGQQFIAGKVVRPFQRMISAQAVYRREAYAP